MPRNGASRPLAVLVTLVLLISVGVLAVSAAPTQLTAAESAEVSALCSIVTLIDGIVSLIILLIIVIGGMLYAVSHLLPAGGQLRQGLQTYAMGMVIGGIVGFMLVIIAQFLLNYFLGQATGGAVAQCPAQMQAATQATYYKITLQSNPTGTDAGFSSSTYSAQAGTSVSICTSEPPNHWQWEDWSGSIAVAAPMQMCTSFTMPAALVVETANWYPCVNVYANSQCSGGACGSGSAGTTSDPSASYASEGNSAPGSYTCAAPGTQITLVSSPDSTSHLCSWTGAGNGGQGVCSSQTDGQCTFTLYYYTSEEGTFLPTSQAC